MSYLCRKLVEVLITPLTKSHSPPGRGVLENLALDSGLRYKALGYLFLFFLDVLVPFCRDLNDTCVCLPSTGSRVRA